MKFFVSAVLLAGALNSAGPDTGAPAIDKRLSALADAGVAESVLTDARRLVDGVDGADDRAALSRLRTRAAAGEPSAAALLARLSEELRVREPERGAFAGWVETASKAENGAVSEMADGLSARLRIYRTYARGADEALATARDRLGVSGNTRAPIPQDLQRAVLTPARVRASSGELREIRRQEAGGSRADAGATDAAKRDRSATADPARQDTEAPRADKTLSLVIGWDRRQARLRAAVEATRRIVPGAMSGVQANMRKMAHPEKGEGYTLILEGIAGVNALNAICEVLQVSDCWAAQREAGRLAAETRSAASGDARAQARQNAAGPAETSDATRTGDGQAPSARDRAADGRADSDDDPVGTVMKSADVPLPTTTGAFRPDPVPARTVPVPETKPKPADVGPPLPDIAARDWVDDTDGEAAGDGDMRLPDASARADLRAELMTRPPERVALSLEAGADEGEPLVFDVPVRARPEKTTLGFRVTGGSADLPANLRFRDAEGARSAGTRADVEAAAGDITVPRGARRVRLELATRQDAYAEDDETVTLALTRDGVEIGRAVGRIRDDDGTARLSLARAADVREGRLARFQIRLDRPRDRRTKVVWRLRPQDGAPTPAPETGHVWIAAGDKRALIEVPVGDDDVYAPSSALTLHLLPPEGVELSGEIPRRFEKVENDARPAVALSLDDAPEGGALPASVDLRRPLAESLTLTWRARVKQPDGADVPGGDDLAVRSGRVSLPAGARTARFEIPVRQDAVHEGPERVRLEVESAASWLSGSWTADAAIVDDDARPEVRLVRTPGGYARDAQTIPMTVRLAAPAGTPLVLGWRVEAVDGPRADGRLTVPAGREEVDVELPMKAGADGLPDVRDLVLTTAGGRSLDRVRIHPAAPASEVVVSETEVREGEILRVPVRLDPPAARWRYLGWQVWGELDQLVGATSGRLAFPPGTSEATIAVATRDDDLFDADGGDDLELELSPAPGLSVPEEPVALRVVDDDPAARIEPVADRTLAEGDRVEIPLRLSRPHDAPVTLRLRQLNPGLHLGADVDGIPETVTIPAGARGHDLDVRVRQDGVHEGRERVDLEVRSGSDVVEGRARFTLDLRDRDPRPELTLEAPETLREGERARVRLDIDPPSARGGWFYPAVSDLPDAGVDLEMPERVLVAPGARQVRFPVSYRDDDRHAPTQTLALGGRFGARSVAGAEVRMVDREPAPDVRAMPARGAEGTDLVFRIELGGPVNVPVTARYTLEPGTADIGPEADLPELTGTLRIAPGETLGKVAVPARADGEQEGAETFSLVLEDWTGVAQGRDLVVGGEIVDPPETGAKELFQPLVRAELSAARWRALQESAARARTALTQRISGSADATDAPDGAAASDSGGETRDSVMEGAEDAAVPARAPSRPYCLLGSLSTVEEARRERRRVARRLGAEALAERTLSVRRLYGGGEAYYAITLSGFADGAAASDLCDRAAARGLSCVAKR